MIAKAYKLKGFRACLDYDISKEKGRVIKSNMEGEDPQSLAKEFAVIRQLKPKVSNAVLHVSLSASIGEKLSDDEWVRIGERYLDGMGYTNNQFVMTRHHDTEHEHIHIVANRISLDGQVVSDSQDYKRQTSLMREIEKDFGLNVISSTSEKKSLKKSEVEKSLRTGEPNMRLILQKLADRAIKNSENIVEYAKQLKTQGVALIATFQQEGQKLTGLVYEKDGFRFKGSDLGKSYTPLGLSKKGLMHEQNGTNDLNGYISNRERNRGEFYQRLSQSIEANDQRNARSDRTAGSIASEVIAGIEQRKRDAIRASKSIKPSDRANTMGQQSTNEKNHDHDGRDRGSERHHNSATSLVDNAKNISKNNNRFADNQSHQSNENRRGSTTSEKEVKDIGLEM